MFNCFCPEIHKISANNVAQEGPVLMSDFKWCDAATALMLKLYRDKQVKFNNPHVKKKVIWREIAEIIKKYVMRVNYVFSGFLTVHSTAAESNEHSAAQYANEITRNDASS